MASDRLRSGASSVRIANSSPPSRATRSPARTEAQIRSVTAWSSAVAGGMAERVVDDLEVVEVDEQDRGDCPAARSAIVARMRSRLIWNIRRLAAPVRESRSARSCTSRSRTALRRFSAAIAQVWPRTASTRRSTPRIAADGCSTTMAPTARPSAIIGATRTLRAPGMTSARIGSSAGSSWRTARISRRSQARATMASGPERDRRHVVDAERGEDDHLVVGCADDDAALEAEALGEPVEHRDRLADRIGHVVEAGADIDDRLEVGAAVAKLALVHGREHRCRQGEQPERHDVEERHPLELDRGAADDVDSRDELGGLRVQHDEQQERVPQRELEPGSIRRQQRHRDEVEIDAGTGAGSGCRR